MSSIEIQNGKKLSMRLLLSFMWIGAFPVFWAITWCVDYRGGDYPLFRDLTFIAILVNFTFALATEFVFYHRREYILGDVFDRLGKVRTITPLLVSLSYLHQMYFPPLDVYIEHRLSIGSGFTNALILSGVVLFLVFPVLAVIEKARLLKGEVQ